LASHSVAADGRAGVRWYEIRDPNGIPAVAQQGTFAPDANHRWMGSIAMDKAGDVLLGYSKSGSSLHPQIFVTGRQATDPPGQMQAELLVRSGPGSQKYSYRWGDYSAMTVDPVDDKTFWYTTEFIVANGSDWATRVASFSFPPSLGLSVAPSLVVGPGGSEDVAVTLSSLLGFAGDVILGSSGAASGITTSFAPPVVSVLPDGSASSTLTVSADAAAMPGDSTLTLTATSGTTSRSAMVLLTVAEGAESAASGVRVTNEGPSQTTWFRGSSDAASGHFAWQAGVPPGGSYSGPADTRLTAPRLDLSSVTSAALIYKYKYQTRRQRDFLEARISADNGRTWRVLSRASGTSPHFPGTWNTARISLDDFVGQAGLLLQFRFTSEAGRGRLGALIDDIAVTRR
jgi:hypothetical protein